MELDIMRINQPISVVIADDENTYLNRVLSTFVGGRGLLVTDYPRFSTDKFDVVIVDYEQRSLAPVKSMVEYSAVVVDLRYEQIDSRPRMLLHHLLLQAGNKPVVVFTDKRHEPNLMLEKFAEKYSKNAIIRSTMVRVGPLRAWKQSNGGQSMTHIYLFDRKVWTYFHGVGPTAVAIVTLIAILITLLANGRWI